MPQIISKIKDDLSTVILNRKPCMIKVDDAQGFVPSAKSSHQTWLNMVSAFIVDTTLAKSDRNFKELGPRDIFNPLLGTYIISLVE